MKYTIYDTTTGQIFYGGEAQDPTSLVQEGQSLLPDQALFSGYLIDGQHFDLPPKPGAYHEFNWVTKVWEDPRTLAELKAAKTAAINASSLAANTSTFPYMGKEFQVDAVSRSYIDGANGAFMLNQGPPPDWPGGWKALDNTYIAISTLEEWTSFYGAMVSAGTANFNHSQALKAQLAAATTPEEVDAVPSW